jgi:hypothetical protein
MAEIYDYSSLVEPDGEVLRQEITTYVMRDGKIIKIFVERDFVDDDYTDSMTVCPIHFGNLRSES